MPNDTPDVLTNALSELVRNSSKEEKLLYYMQPKQTDTHDMYQSNIIAWMLLNPTMDKKSWPSFTINQISNDSAPDQLLTFYKNLRSIMTSEYSSYMIKNNKMKTYDQVARFKNMIDMAKIMKSAEQAADGLLIPFLNFKNMDKARKIGWKCFVPYSDELVIKNIKNHYLYIKITDFDPNSRSYKLLLENYIGNSHDWILHDRIKFQLRFGESDINDKLPLGWDILETQSYDEIITEYIPEMKNWTNSQKLFWHDLFGVYNIQNTTIIRLYKPISVENKLIKDKDEFADFTLTNEMAINAACSSKMTSDFVKIIARGQDALDIEHEKTATTFLILFFNIMCGIINLTIDSSQKPIKNENGNWTISDIVFKAENNQTFQDWLFGPDIRGKLVTT